MKVIQHIDVSEATMVARWPREGTEAIEVGSQLAVEESQEAVFLGDGEALDTFGPGRHTLAIDNLPLLVRLLGPPLEGSSPLRAAVVFLSTRTFPDLKWGTKEPVVYRDSELAMVRLRAFGKLAVRIRDSQVFVSSVVGTMSICTTEALVAWFREIIVARLDECLDENLQSIFDLPKVYAELASGLEARVSEDLARQGIELLDLSVGAFTPTKQVRRLIDERAGLAAVADMNASLKLEVSRAMGEVDDF